MQAAVGERLVIHSKAVGTPDRHGEVLEVRGSDGGPPYLVRFDDGHETPAHGSFTHAPSTQR